MAETTSASLLVAETTFASHVNCIDKPVSLRVAASLQNPAARSFFHVVIVVMLYACFFLVGFCPASSYAWHGHASSVKDHMSNQSRPSQFPWPETELLTPLVKRTSHPRGWQGYVWEKGGEENQKRPTGRAETQEPQKRKKRRKTKKIANSRREPQNPSSCSLCLNQSIFLL